MILSLNNNYLKITLIDVLILLEIYLFGDMIYSLC